MTLHIMSDRELARLEVLRDLTSGRLTASAAAELLGLERRQVQRLAKVHQDQGATALISKKRGRPSNRQTPVSVKAQALEVIREKYADFGPTLAAEKLRELHGITIGRGTLRIWMLEAGLWADRQKRRGRVYPPQKTGARLVAGGSGPGGRSRPDHHRPGRARRDQLVDLQSFAARCRAEDSRLRIACEVRLGALPI